MEKPKLTKQQILQRLKERLETLFLVDTASIHADVWHVPQRDPRHPNWDVSFTGVSFSDQRAVEATADLVRREVDLE
ncbi:MAG: hypothetical protein RLT05_19500 [Bauldia litoralis]